MADEVDRLEAEVADLDHVPPVVDETIRGDREFGGVEPAGGGGHSGVLGHCGQCLHVIVVLMGREDQAGFPPMASSVAMIVSASFAASMISWSPVAFEVTT